MEAADGKLDGSLSSDVYDFVVLSTGNFSRPSIPASWKVPYTLNQSGDLHPFSIQSHAVLSHGIGNAYVPASTGVCSVVLTLTFNSAHSWLR